MLTLVKMTRGCIVSLNLQCLNTYRAQLIDHPALLLAYGASTTTTLIPTLTYLLNPSIVSPPLSSSELLTLLSSYIPFLLIPLTVTIDMGWRLMGIISQAQERKRI